MFDEQEKPSAEAWDCDPFAPVSIREWDADLDEEDDEGDWQVIVLERFHDRFVCLKDDLHSRGDASEARCW